MIGARNSQSSFQTLRSLTLRKEREEHCELCHQKLGPGHDHLVEPIARKILCTCTPCNFLFSSPAAAKYKRVPRRVAYLADFAITDAEWDALAIPIGMAFFLKNGIDGRISAIYPSPAGPVESLLSLDSWDEIAARNSKIGSMEADVEAVLANRVAGEYHLVPIDECYRLVGMIRARWRGLSGGTEVWTDIRSFFRELRSRAEVEAVHA